MCSPTRPGQQKAGKTFCRWPLCFVNLSRTLLAKQLSAWLAQSIWETLWWTNNESSTNETDSFTSSCDGSLQSRRKVKREEAAGMHADGPRSSTTTETGKNWIGLAVKPGGGGGGRKGFIIIMTMIKNKTTTSMATMMMNGNKDGWIDGEQAKLDLHPRCHSHPHQTSDRLECTAGSVHSGFDSRVKWQSAVLRQPGWWWWSSSNSGQSHHHRLDDPFANTLATTWINKLTTQFELLVCLFVYALINPVVWQNLESGSPLEDTQCIKHIDFTQANFVVTTWRNKKQTNCTETFFVFLVLHNYSIEEDNMPVDDNDTSWQVNLEWMNHLRVVVVVVNHTEQSGMNLAKLSRVARFLYSRSPFGCWLLMFDAYHHRRRRRRRRTLEQW